ncbi:MAG: hypothetical protein IPP60_03250 [Sphingobacteriales bacterium]|nr:hypothetical protein [Sphingobacteriales bacterium]
MIISNNPKLKSIVPLKGKYPAVITQYVIIKNNLVLDSISEAFDTSNSTIRYLQIDNNPAFNEFNFLNRINLDSIIISNNSLLYKITLKNSPSLKYADVSNNAILDSLIIGNNALYDVVNSFSITNNPKLVYIKEFGAYSYAKKLNIVNNNTLRDLNFLYNFSQRSFSSIDSLVIYNNPSLVNCCGIYNLLLRGGVRSIYITSNPSACSNESEIITYCNNPATTNFVYGRVYSDLNTNNKPDASDIFIDNIKIQIAKNGNNTTHITSDTGRYYFVNDTGSYTIQPISNFSNFATIPVSQIITRITYGNKDTINFKLAPTALLMMHLLY